MYASNMHTCQVQPRDLQSSDMHAGGRLHARHHLQSKRRLRPQQLHAGAVVMPNPALERTFFVPGDWVLQHRAGNLRATKLSTGEVMQIDGVAADDVIDRELQAPTWSAMARHEPLVGELCEQLASNGLAPLNRATVLRGAGWRQLFIELTARCNERCLHCYAESSPERIEELDWDDIRAVVDDAKSLEFQVVQLTGGDPLVSRHCLPAAEYAKDIGIENVEVYTNGLALRGKTYERLRDLGVSFAFSFYSHDANQHDAITRTRGSHERTTRAIRRAVGDGLAVRTGTVMMNENAGAADQTHDYLVQLGVKPEAVGMDLSRDVGRGEFPVSDSGRGPSGGLERRRTRGFGGSAAVGYDGFVYPCIFSRHLALGSIRERALAEILEAPEPIDLPAADFLEKRLAWASSLSCWECQTRSVMLGATRHA